MLIVFCIDLPHIGRFLYPHISPIPPPIGRPPSVHREGEGVLGRYLNGKQLGLSKKNSRKNFYKNFRSNLDIFSIIIILIIKVTSILYHQILIYQIRIYVIMKRVIRMTEEELQGLVNRSAKRILREHINRDNEIKLAYKELQQMGKHLSSIGLRLDGTEYQPLYQRMRDAIVELNNALIKQLRGKA